MQYFYVIKNIGRHACLREREHLFRDRAYLEENLLHSVRARAHVHSPMTRIFLLCAVVRSRVRNAKLRNHLKLLGITKLLTKIRRKTNLVRRVQTILNF